MATASAGLEAGALANLNQLRLSSAAGAGAGAGSGRGPPHPPSSDSDNNPPAFSFARRPSTQSTDFGDWDAHSSAWSHNSTTSSSGPSPPPPGPGLGLGSGSGSGSGFDPRRRGSAVSTTSSQSAAWPTSSLLHLGHAHDPNRNSLSSFASSSGSPMATASTFSAGERTIGDLSTASMPLLNGGAGGSDTDADSVHSYPPWPRPRADSSLDGHDRLEEGRLGASRTGSSTDLARDHWSAYVARPALPPRVTNTPPLPTPNYNPLAPLRKRFARAIGAGRKVTVELQLVVELVDALEHCISAFSGKGDDPLGLAASSSNSSSGPLAQPSTSPGSDGRPGSAGSSASMSYLVGLSAKTAMARAADLELMNEVRSLVKELVEICPDAQTCLTNGEYGPLAYGAPAVPLPPADKPPSIGGGARLRSAPSSLSTRQANLADHAAAASDNTKLDMKDPGTPEWWPRRLARDCRLLLDEVGVALGGGQTPTLLLAPRFGGERVGEGGSDEDAEEEGEVGEEDEEEKARQRELREEGVRRWEAYRQSQVAGEGSAGA